MFRFLLAASLGLAFSSAGFAQSEPADAPVKVSLVAAKVVTADGKEKLVPADAAKPGEVVRYTATYKNDSDKGVKKLQATVPVPVGTEVLLESIKPAGAKASLDKEHFEAIPLKREEEMPDGKKRLVNVPTNEYRAIRWSLEDLGAGKSTAVSVDVRLLISAPKATEAGKQEGAK